jgi:phosphoribosylamine--glycine ligase
MLKYGIPTAKHFSCHSAEEAVDAAREIAKDSPGVVVKPSGLTAGKGVTLCRNLEEARTAIDLIMTQSSYGKAGTELVVEEYLEGQEVSILAFCDGLNMRTMPAAQDHKALCDGDVGPNTGGMGAYAPAPCATASVMEEVHHTIIERTQKGLRLEGISYTGVLYFGLMLTERGPKVLEYNCRFGDPEAQAVLALLDSDLAETMLACVHGRIQEAEPVWSSEHAACVVMCSKGYPGPYAKGALITGIETAEASEAVFVYHAGTAYELDKTLRSAGGRVLGVTARAADLESAIDQAYKGVKAIDFEGKFFRTDIAAKAVKAQNAPL